MDYAFKFFTETVKLKEIPPPVLNDARVLEYAIVDDVVRYTDRLRLYANGNRVGPVPCLAICQDFFDSELMLVHCNEEWEVLAVQAWNGPAATPADSVDEVKRRAERYYEGISQKWIAHNASEEEARAYYDSVQKHRTCSFCGRPPHEIKAIVRGKSCVICNFCIDKYYEAIHSLPNNNDTD